MSDLPTPSRADNGSLPDVKPQFKTVMATLTASEEVRQKLWQACEKHTLLVNHLLERIKSLADTNLTRWKEKKGISRKELESILADSDLKDYFYANLNQTFRESALILVCRTYKSWLASNKKLERRLQRNRRYLPLLITEVEDRKASIFSQEDICNRARNLLTEIVEQPSPTKETSPSNGALTRNECYERLYSIYDNALEAHDILTRRAIVHLMRHNFEVSQTDEDPEALQKQIRTKRVEIKRLEKKLQAMSLPKGRDITGELFRRGIETAIALPNHADINHAPLNQLQQEVEAWLPQKQIRFFNSECMPFLFESAGDLYWSYAKPVNPQPNPPCLQELTINKSKHRKRSKKRSKINQPRIEVRFKGESKLVFKLNCDRRHLHFFRQFVDDYQLNKQTKKGESGQFGEGLFLFRSAQLIWVKDDTLYQYAKKQKYGQKNLTNLSDCQRLEENLLPPWKTHRLYLHCTIDPALATAEGTEQVRQAKIRQTKAKLEKAENPPQSTQKEERKISPDDAQSVKSTDSAKNAKDQENYLKRLKSTLRNLNHPTPPRPSQPLYQGYPHLAIGVSFSRQETLTITLVNVNQPELELGFCSAKELLVYHRFKLKGVNRNVRLTVHHRVIKNALLYKFTQALTNPQTLESLLVCLFLKRRKTGRSYVPLTLQYHLNAHCPVLETFPMLLLLNLWVEETAHDVQIIDQLHRLHHRNTIERTKEQKRDFYRAGHRESNLRFNLDRTIAASLVELALEVQASRIILPDLSNIRERVEAAIWAEAEQMYPHYKEKQQSFAQEIRARFHR